MNGLVNMLQRMIDESNGGESSPCQCTLEHARAAVQGAAKAAAREADALKLAEKVARLNPAAGEIGAGMLAQLVAEATRITENT